MLRPLPKLLYDDAGMTSRLDHGSSREAQLLAEIARLRLLLDEAGIDETGQRRGGSVHGYDRPFFAAFRHTRMPMAVTDPSLPDNPLVFVNAAFLDLTGYAESEVLGRNCRFLQGPGTDPEAVARIRRAIVAGEEITLDILNYRRNGSAFWNELYICPIRDPDGCIRHFFASQVDVTRRQDAERAEVELRRLNETLEQRVAEAVAERERALAHLAQSQKLEALGQLAGGVAHDFNNALQTITGGARMILRRGGDAAAAQRFAGMVLEAANRGTSVTRRLLAFARRDALRAEPVDVAELLGGLQEVLAHTLGPQIRIQVEIPSDLPAPHADRSQLETVLVNLAANARDALLPAGGTVTLSAGVEEVADPRAHLAALPAGAYLRLAVRDTGAGMDQDTLAHATEPFFTTKPQGKGTGLGLSMARGFAEQSGGGLMVESVPGRGTSVTLWLPLLASGAGEGSNYSPQAQPSSGANDNTCRAPARLLLVDDDQLVRSTLAAELRDRGYEVAEAVGGAAALGLLDAGEWVDLLVTDLSMPGMDGATLIYESQKRRSGLPAVLVTGYAGDGAALAVRGVAPNATFNLLRKPTSATELGDLVAALLHRRSLEA
jgi:PAS domain S-box-containing protein